MLFQVGNLSQRGHILLLSEGDHQACWCCTMPEDNNRKRIVDDNVSLYFQYSWHLTSPLQGTAQCWALLWHCFWETSLWKHERERYNVVVGKCFSWVSSADCMSDEKPTRGILYLMKLPIWFCKRKERYTWCLYRIQRNASECSQYSPFMRVDY